MPGLSWKAARQPDLCTCLPESEVYLEALTGFSQMVWSGDTMQMVLTTQNAVKTVSLKWLLLYIPECTFQEQGVGRDEALPVAWV